MFGQYIGQFKYSQELSRPTIKVLLGSSIYLCEPHAAKTWIYIYADDGLGIYSSLMRLVRRIANERVSYKLSYYHRNISE